MTARTRDPEATRAAILDAAETEIVEHGFAEASTAAIARRAGVTKSLIHHHFGSKEGLWTEVKVRRFSDYANRQMEMLQAQRPDADLLKESMRVYFHFLQENPELMRMMAWMFLEESEQEPCHDLDRELTITGVAKIQEAQQRGELRSDLNPGFILFTFIGICQHWFQDKRWMLSHVGLSADSAAIDEAYLDDALKIFFEGVLPR